MWGDHGSHVGAARDTTLRTDAGRAGRDAHDRRECRRPGRGAPLVTGGGTRGLWLGLPPLPPRVRAERGPRAGNALFAELPTRFPGLVRFVPTDTVLGAPDGTFARSLPGVGGAVVPVRKE